MSSNKHERDQKSTQTAMRVLLALKRNPTRQPPLVERYIAETVEPYTDNEELIFPAVSHVLRTVLPSELLILLETADASTSVICARLLRSCCAGAYIQALGDATRLAVHQGHWPGRSSTVYIPAEIPHRSTTGKYGNQGRSISDRIRGRRPTTGEERVQQM
ncbi:hypothetical protein T4D_12776 [Trichinella pseudospiralis]|uniref:Uncharacterized protein n=1 Tax=Trichinella pseudospiralis TaxID=6337 RepID=A0A0V1F8U4_TRIPS|nr:hypothetical protein T4D_12776 [Trichinella pseudospiralis]